MRSSLRRSPSMKSLKNLVKIGCLGSFVRKSRTPEVSDMIALVTEPSLAIPSTLDNVLPLNKLDETAAALFKIFGAQGRLIPFVFKLAEWDVNQCDTEKLLFRRNSLSTKIITAALKTFGQNVSLGF
jgi:hypothetical protein